MRKTMIHFLRIAAITWILCSSVFCIDAAAQLHSDNYPIEKAKRIVFLGNSITYAGDYVSLFETYYRTRYPGSPAEIINLGLPSETVSGLSEPDHAKGAFPRPCVFTRLTSVLEKTKPDVVFACYGMNDGIYLPFDKKRFQAYKDGINKLYTALSKAGVKRIILITPPVHDDAEKALNGYNLVLDRYAEWLLDQRAKQKWEVIDVHFAMRDFLNEKRKAEPGFKLASDGIHPGKEGHWQIARSISNYFGAEWPGTITLTDFLETSSLFSDVYTLVSKRQAVMKDSWLTYTGHNRPKMAKGIPMAEAEKVYQQTEKQLHQYLSPSEIKIQTNVKQEPSNMIYDRIMPAPVEGGFKMEGYWVWCGSVIKGEDNRYHMFASRWPATLPFHPGWMVASEVVRASSDKPEGPYRFEEVVLPARGAQYWDGRATHNPSIAKYKDTYVLFYMGSTHPFPDPKEGSLNLNSPETTVARSNKRIGIATSKSIFGPWERQDKPVLETKPNTFYSFLTSNPAPAIRKDGSVLLVFKGRGHKAQFPYQTKQSLGIAYAASIKDPFTVLNHDLPILNANDFGEVEDPFLWEDDAGLHLLVKDMTHNLTGEHHAGALLHSQDGLKWELDKKPKAYSRQVLWSDGKIINMGQMERPFILMENGIPAYLFFATMDGKGGFENGNTSWNMVLPLKK